MSDLESPPFAAIVCARKAALGLTHADLGAAVAATMARTTGRPQHPVNASTVSRWMAGTSTPDDPELIEALAAVIQVDATELALAAHDQRRGRRERRSEALAWMPSVVPTFADIETTEARLAERIATLDAKLDAILSAMR